MQSPAGQNYLSRKITARLSRDLNTRITAQNVNIALFNRVSLQGVLIEDRQQDTILYAGSLNLRITDWFFIKDKIELKYIGLDNAVIRLQRDDSVWRHQFILDYFGGSGKSQNKSSSTELNLKKVVLNHVRIEQRDAWFGRNMNIGIGSLNLDANYVDFNDLDADIEKLVIEQPDFLIYDYAGKRPRKTNANTGKQKTPVAISNDSTLKWNAAGWVVNAKLVELKNGRFRSQRAGVQPSSWFDGRYIDFHDIQTRFESVNWTDDTIKANMFLSTKERSGFEVKKMGASVFVNPTEMVFAKMEIRTNNSVIRDYYRMSFDDFSALNDYIHAVQMEGNFDHSEIDSDDIAFFAPALSSWKKNITINGRIRGTVDDLVARGLEIEAGPNSYLNGDISLTGLPDINQTFIDFKANEFRTTYESAVTIVPALAKVTTPDLRKLAYLRFNGSFTGFIRDFVTYGTFQTNLGNVKTDLNMKLPAGNAPVYSGTIESDYFKLGELLNDKQIGALAIKGSLKGRGFHVSNRNAEIDGVIPFVEYNDYKYNNIKVKGRLDRKLFEGEAAIQDPEVSLALNGLIDYNQEIPVFNLEADVVNANLQKLNLTQDAIQFSGLARLNMSGNNIDNFLGRAEIVNASLMRNGRPLPFDSLVLTASVEGDQKTIHLRSNEIDGNITGKFNILELPNAVRLFLNKYYPAYIKPPTSIPSDASFVFDISTYYVDDYIQLIDSSLYGFENSRFMGKLDTKNNILQLNATVPQFKWDTYNFDDVRVTAQGTADSLKLIGGATNIRVSDSLNIPFAFFNIGAHNDVSNVRIYTGANQAIDEANINAQVNTFDNGVRINFDSSHFTINGKSWTIEKDGELEFRSNIPARGQMVMRESNQLIKIQTRPSETGDWNDLLVQLEKVNMGDIGPFLLPRNRIEGLLSGNITVEDPINNPYVSSNDVQVESFRLDNDSIGNANIQLVYDGKMKLLTAKGATENTENNLAFDLTIYTGDKNMQRNNLIKLQAKTYPVKILERFLGNLFSDMRGYVTGNFNLEGPLSDINVTGKGRLQNAGLKVNFTQCYYEIADTDLEMKTNLIDLNGLILRDPVTKNPIYLTGGIEHEAFDNMFFDLTVSTQKPNTVGAANNLPVQLLNTSFNDNKQFYGNVKGTGSFSLIGPQSDLYMKIDANAATTDSSSVTLPLYEGRETGIADFLVERTYGTEMIDSSFRIAGDNITYDVDVTANPMVTVKVILDELTGDKIEGKGSGTLNIRAGTSEKLSMRGRFDIEEGNYLFTFQSFFKKPFEIRKGSENYITWNGDPMSAQIQFEAMYTAENVSFAPLADLLASSSEYSRHRENVWVIAKLRGELFRPEFTFKLEFPPNGRASTDFGISSAIQQIEKNINEMNRQVTYLIVFNSFAPPDYASSTGLNTAIGEFTNSTISSISGLFFNEINRKLNSELSRILNTDNISINFSGSVYNRNLLNASSSGGLGFNQTNFNVNVPISMFKDRFIVTLGSTLDVPLQSTIQQNVQFLPDVTAEWLINQSGTIRASFFYRQNLDYLTSSSSGAARTKRTGASIAYRKEFDTIKEFFRKKSKSSL